MEDKLNTLKKLLGLGEQFPTSQGEGKNQSTRSSIFKLEPQESSDITSTLKALAADIANTVRLDEASLKGQAFGAPWKFTIGDCVQDQDEGGKDRKATLVALLEEDLAKRRSIMHPAALAYGPPQKVAATRQGRGHRGITHR